jgi:antirestriction protein
MNTPKIYVGTYAKYNSGSIAGGWLDLDDYSDISEFYDACKELHNDESDSEFMFQDYENIPDSLIGESWISEEFWPYMQAVSQLDNSEAFDAFISNYSYDLNSEDIDSLIERFEDSYEGEQSKSDFAYDIVQEHLSGVADFIATYFDYEKFERDLFMDGYTEIDGFIFRDI